jgi:hypothetical protein
MEFLHYAEVPLEIASHVIENTTGTKTLV